MNVPQNILYVTESCTPHDLRFLKAIGRQTSRLWFAWLDRSRKIRKDELPESVSIWPGIDSPPPEWGRWIRELEIQLLHAGPLNTVLPHFSGSVDCAVVGMSWGSDILALDSGKALQKNSLFESLSKIDALIVDCRAVINKIRQLQPDFDIPCIEFPWGVEWDKFENLPGEKSAALRKQLGWEDKIVLISTRSWAEGYGVSTLLEAFEILLQRLPGLRLLLIGDGPLREEIFAQIDERKLNDKIHCAGRIGEEDLPLWYGAADLYVSAALTDGTSVSLLEAMASGLPVIAHRDHGNIEWVVEDENGWLIDCRQPEEISEAIFKAVRERPFAAIRTANRLKARQRADWGLNSQNISRAYALAYQNYLRRKTISHA